MRAQRLERLQAQAEHLEALTKQFGRMVRIAREQTDSGPASLAYLELCEAAGQMVAAALKDAGNLMDIMLRLSDAKERAGIAAGPTLVCNLCGEKADRALGAGSKCVRGDCLGTFGVPVRRPPV